ncbi:DUF6159 family protein [Natronolimnohabitans innermongolicus]|uniref:Glycerophosphoryl diester phosphodiesterase membrane domain-containing protein n=1 Tax=Natronolimnohabitans innermongolicus JCM 12255 TaxID=1227499 RepID=L9X2Q8_9EURY|nr:DUF6159 family protein [Natronolimnohabitans innermongolicus]ELY55902.1 hypothetical protein C493_10503 [Natronolimnohabitans innermongolicus JCM 12255]
MALQSILARFKTGFAIAKASLGVLRREKWLLAFPLLYGLALVVGMGVLIVGVAAALLGTTFGLAALDQVAGLADGTGETTFTVLGLVVSFLGMFAATSIATFFSAALVYSVGELFAGEQTSLRSGLAGAWRAKRTILAWGVVGAVVGMIFRALESQDGWGAQLVRMITGAAWFMMTFFIVPVIVFQEGGVRQSLRESITTFRETWGETGGVTLGIGLVILPLILLTLAAGIGAPLLLAADPASVIVYTIAPTLLVVGALLVIQNAAVAIAKTALYKYATDGDLPEEFDGIDPDAITKSKRSSSAAMGGTTGRKPGQI